MSKPIIPGSVFEVVNYRTLWSFQRISDAAPTWRDIHTAQLDGLQSYDIEPNVASVA
ncbi:MAG: hypothetical protein IT191_08600 [Microbacteriaceae bacterium]|nr:hypothetical protein [Microbacteriaceae bacterium]